MTVIKHPIRTGAGVGPEFWDLLDVVREAIDIPDADSDENWLVRHRLFAKRKFFAQIAMRAALRPGQSAAAFADNARWLREQLAKHPVTYQTADDAPYTPDETTSAKEAA